MFNWIVSNIWQDLEPFYFVDLSQIELLEIELFDYSTVLSTKCVYKSYISDIYVKTGFGIK